MPEKKCVICKTQKNYLNSVKNLQIVMAEKVYVLSVGMKEKKSQWIPIEKKLPKKGTYVLASFDDGFVSAVEFADDWELWADSGEVIAWQPLPKAYKKSKKSNAI